MNKHIGSSIDDLMIEEGIYRQAQDYAAKKVIDWLSRQKEKCGDPMMGIGSQAKNNQPDRT